jgi:hypothetical protein
LVQTAKRVGKQRKKTVKGAGGSARSALVVKDDLPGAIPVLDREADIIDAYLCHELAPLLPEPPPRLKKAVRRSRRS